MSTSNRRRRDRSSRPHRDTSEVPTVLVEPLEGRLFLSASDIDPTFGVGGKALMPALGNGFFSSVIAAPGGKYLAVGERVFDYNFDFMVARFNANGTPDKSFGPGANGRVFTDFGGLDVAQAAAVLPSGKILVAGYGGDPDGRTSFFCIARYTANGILDTTFGGGDGKLTTSFGAGSASATGLKALSSGKFLVSGNGGGFAVARYNSNGSLDLSFGPSGTGKAIANIGTGQYANGMTVGSSGQIYLAGSVFSPNDNSDILVVRFTAGGSLDSGFGAGKGWVTTDLTSATNPSATDDAYKIAITPAGKVLVLGLTAPSNNLPNRFALVQYNVNGSLDSGFGGGTGKVLTSPNPDPLSSSKPVSHTNLVFNGTGLFVTASGKIVAAGYGSGDSRKDGFIYAHTEAIGIARYNANGSLDQSFGVGGKMHSTVVSSTYSVMLDGAGKIVIASAVDNKAALIRFGTPTVTTASISGTIFNDKNGDGIRQSVTEPILSDWQAFEDINNNGVYDYGEPTAFSDGTGKYVIKGLAAGSHRIREVRKDGWTRTAPAGAWPAGYYDVVLSTGAAVTGRVFGNRKSP